MSRKWLRGLAGYGIIAVLFFAITMLMTAAPGQQAPAAPQPQENAPVKSAASKPDEQRDDTPTQDQMDKEFKITSNVKYVSTPVTVFDSGGQLVYDLQKDEFKIFDNGQLQTIQGFDTEMEHLSLVIIVETNESTAAFLDAVRPLGSMFSDLVMGPQGDVAVLTYSDRVHLALDFTSDGDKLDTTLRGLQGRGSGMHVDDALVLALSKLNHQPRSDRKVIIAFSDGFNIGSKMHRSEIVRGAMNSNITIYHLGFSPVKGLWKRQANDPPPDLVAESVGRGVTPNSAPTPTASENLWEPNDINIVSILLGLGEEVKKPVMKDSMIYFSRYSGGRSYQKWDKNTVQEALNNIATEIHSQYEVSYAVSDPVAAGFHKIEVEVRRPGAKVRSRSGWFYQGDVPTGVVVKSHTKDGRPE